ncbi:glycosyltransferase family 4 protein [Candidatus Falkowbacteria bacterium]|nr:glycosyltransferase family 4 protein [Candidatus Falkowbacteria bacterium]
MPENVQKKLNIAMVCDPIDYTAGAFVSTLLFADLLKSRGHKVIFISAMSPQNKKPIDYYKGTKVYRFASVLLPKTEKQLYVSFPTSRKIRKILSDEQIDILHNTIPTPSSVIATKVAKSMGVKIVTHSHSQPENIFLHLPKMMPKKALNVVYYKFMHWLYRQADAVIYPSEFAKRMFPELHDEVRSEVISNGVNIERFKKVDASRFFKKFELDRSKKHLLYVGRFHPEKSIETLINATPQIIKEYPESHVIMAGSGHMEDKMKRLAKDVGMDKHITFCGRVNDEDLVLAYNAADIFVLPSLAELEGMVVLEAMACGDPILIADAKYSASTDFVKGNGFLFKAEDSGDLAEKALVLLRDEKLRQSMAEESLRASREYDINRSVDRILDLFYSLL